jgi:hypothetical protein
MPYLALRKPSGQWARGEHALAVLLQDPDYPARISEIIPVPIPQPIGQRRQPQRRSPREDEARQQPGRKSPPPEGHIIDEYAA